MTIALATVKSLEGRINANTAGVGDLTPLLFQCLESATIQLLEIISLNSFTAAAGVVETFVVPEMCPLDDNRHIRFRLNNGFVDESTTPVSIVYGVTEEDLDAALPVVDTYMKIDAEKGLVYFDTLGFSSDLQSISRRITPDGGFGGWFFRITYDHGWESKTEPYGKVYKTVPDWLREAALIKAREIYQLTIPVKERKATVSSVNLGSIVDRHIRWYPTALNPILS